MTDKFPQTGPNLDPASQFFAEDMFDELCAGLCDIEFTKQNGETRKMRATLSPSYMPVTEENPYDKSSYSPTPGEAIKVWDTEKHQWRSVFPNSVSKFEIL